LGDNGLLAGSKEGVLLVVFVQEGTFGGGVVGVELFFHFDFFAVEYSSDLSLDSLSEGRLGGLLSGLELSLELLLSGLVLAGNELLLVLEFTNSLLLGVEVLSGNLLFSQELFSLASFLFLQVFEGDSLVIIKLGELKLEFNSVLFVSCLQDFSIDSGLLPLVLFDDSGVFLQLDLVEGFLFLCSLVGELLELLLVVVD